ncbi:MAG: helix-turn-helix transcriptional regulator [Methylobacter sp.]|nr:helix-turn-helix transcriptional regulator [Methylobacter sp.]
MRTWARELESYTHDYVRRGGKQNRRKQVSLIVNFLEFIDAHEGLTSLHRLGKRHVIIFWKAHREMPEKSAYDHWLGLCQLWGWLGKSEKPPRPHKTPEIQARTEQMAVIAPPKIRVCSDLGEAVKAARGQRNLTVAQLANLSGLEVAELEGIERGQSGLPCSDVQRLLVILDIRLCFRSENR